MISFLLHRHLSLEGYSEDTVRIQRISYNTMVPFDQSEDRKVLLKITDQSEAMKVLLK